LNKSGVEMLAHQDRYWVGDFYISARNEELNLLMIATLSNSICILWT